MGYEAPKTVYKLGFDGTDLDGLTVRVKALTFQEMLDNNDVLFEDWTNNPDLPAEEKKTRRDALHELFIRQLVEWDLEQDGKPIPATLEGLRSLEVPLVGSLVWAWRLNALGVPAPLGQPSTDGELSVEESIPMESPSGSLVS